jgi:peptidyl-prolyl cis-trans isomerase SurA
MLLIVPVLALVLTACGASGPRPGTALALDGARVTTGHVDDVAARYCSALAKVGTSVSAQAVRTQVVSALAARMVAERFAEVDGIDPGASYATEVNQLRKQLSTFDEKTQDAIVEVEGSQSYVSAVIGKSGEKPFTDWLASQHVVVNPVYGISLDDGRFTQVDPSISVAASQLAKSAVKSASDPSAEPASGSQACG